MIVHIGQVTAGTVRVGASALAKVSTDRRWDIMRNHTATHLLHAELRYILGTHVRQASSLVAPDRLRFDFTHPTMLSEQELKAIEQGVNDAIFANYPWPEQEATRTPWPAARWRCLTKNTVTRCVWWRLAPRAKFGAGALRQQPRGQHQRNPVFHVVNESSTSRCAAN